MAEMASHSVEEMEVEEGSAAGSEIKLTPGGEVVKTVLRAGEGTETPAKDDEVAVHYTGTLLDGTKFDSSVDRGVPFTFTLGQGSVIAGWDVGVATMTKGEKALLTIAASHAYGERGSPPKIPANATLRFEVELLSWKSGKDLSGDGGVVKAKVLQEGAGWERVFERDEVNVWYSVKAKGAAEPALEAPADGVWFSLKDGHLCRALALALPEMKKGEEALLDVAPEYGFGAEGRDGVPGGARLELTLRLVGWRRVEDVAPGVVKKTLTPAEGWDTPNEGAAVTVSYAARVGSPQGPVFEEKQGLEFVTEEDQVPEALELAVMKMKKGEQAEVSVSAERAYGDAGFSGGDKGVDVPPGSQVVYTVTLDDFKKGKESWEMDDAEKVEASRALKQAGNALFKAGRPAAAAKKYARALKAVEYDDSFGEDAKKAAREVRRGCNLNLAACHLQAGDWKAAAGCCDKVLAVDGGCTKALYRRAQARLSMQEFVEAAMDIKAGLDAEPGSREFQLLKRRLRAEEAAASKKERKMWSAAFGPRPTPKPAAVAEEGAGGAGDEEMKPAVQAAA